MYCWTIREENKNITMNQSFLGFIPNVNIKELSYFVGFDYMKNETITLNFGH